MKYDFMFASISALISLLFMARETQQADNEGKFKWTQIFSKSDNPVKFYLYNRQRLDNPENMEIDDRDGSLYTSFDPNKPTKMIIHGWLGSDDVRFSKRFRKGLLDKMDVNVIGVDWSGLGSKQIYPMSKSKVPQVARLVAEFLNYLSKERGVKLEKLHVLGHSLGAHIAGIAGNSITAARIGRITGFDPAGIFFSKDKPDKRLNPSSANFVDVIHTCGKYLGLQAEMGHVDFYPNGGKRKQPGCGRDLKGTCSHRRAYLLYLDSITNQTIFPAVSCPRWENFLSKENCDMENVAYMGEGVSESARGRYYLETRGDPPYGLGRI